MNAPRWTAVLLTGIVFIYAAGCQAANVATTGTVTPSPGRVGSFTPYRTITPSLTATRPTTTPPTYTPLPTITPTPRTHVVKAGEDMSGIALRYRVPLADLKTANPTVNPRLMKIGTVLIIPGIELALTGDASATATPQAISIRSAICSPDASGGAWCFLVVRNASSLPVINVTLQVRLVDAEGKQIAQQSIAMPLDLLPAASSLPLAAYFPPPLAGDIQVEAQITSALPASAAADHYPAVQVSEPQTEIAADGLSARVRGRVELAAGQAEPLQLALLAVAYDASGGVVGLRRFDSLTPPRAGQPVDFQIQVFSAGSRIAKIAVIAEARK
jgi:LysM repeat protein